MLREVLGCHNFSFHLNYKKYSKINESHHWILPQQRDSKTKTIKYISQKQTHVHTATDAGESPYQTRGQVTEE